MTRGRLEAFSDGVIAILITIMVLELHPPEGTRLADLAPLLPKLLSYLLSFVFLAIYWNNHHHLMHAVERVDGRVLWANVHLLFWLSLMPFVTAWMGEHAAAPDTVALYAAVQLLSGVAYFGLTRSLLALHGPGSRLAAGLGNDAKGKLSVAVYAVAIPLAFAWRWLAVGLVVAVAAWWLVPDRRFARAGQAGGGEG
ncbi:MAG: TMEM175 family protein [Anaeromyxobacter sp.]